MFFFEKKNQKTFAHFARRVLVAGAFDSASICKSFLVLFFKKERLSYYRGTKSARLNCGVVSMFN